MVSTSSLEYKNIFSFQIPFDMHFFIHFNKATVSSSCKQHKTPKFVPFLNNINNLWEQLLGSGGRRYIREYNSKSTTKFQIINQPNIISGIEPNRLISFCYHTFISFDHNWRIKKLSRQEHCTGGTD